MISVFMSLEFFEACSCTDVGNCAIDGESLNKSSIPVLLVSSDLLVLPFSVVFVLSAAAPNKQEKKNLQLPNRKLIERNLQTKISHHT